MRGLVGSSLSRLLALVLVLLAAGACEREEKKQADTKKSHAAQAGEALIADMNQPSRLHALTVQMHLATTDGFGRKRACLEKTRRPQPFINPDRIHQNISAEKHTGINNAVGVLNRQRDHDQP